MVCSHVPSPPKGRAGPRGAEEGTGDYGLHRLGALREQPQVGCCDGCPVDPAHLTQGPRLPLQEQLKAGWGGYRTPSCISLLFVSVFFCEFSFRFPKELHHTFSSLPLLGADNTELSKICVKLCYTLWKQTERTTLTCPKSWAGGEDGEMFHLLYAAASAPPNPLHTSQSSTDRKGTPS